MKTDIKGVLQWTWMNLAGFRRRIAASIFCGVVRVALSLIFVWVSKRLVDTAVGSTSDPHLLLVLSITLVTLMLGEIAMSLLVQYLNTHTDVRFKNRLRLRLLNHILVSRWIEHEHIHSGDMISRLTEDLRQFSDVATSRLQQIVVMTVQFIGAFVLFCFLSWKLALFVVGIMPVCILLSKRYVKKTRRLTAAMREAESDIQVGMQEGIQHHLVVQTLEAKGNINDRVDSSQSWLYNKAIERLNFSIFSRGMVMLGFVGCFLTAFLWSVWHLYTGVITFGTMTAFLQLVNRLQNPVVNISHQIPALVQSLTSIDRLMEIENLKAESHGKPVMLKDPIGIRCNDLCFRYADGKRWIFDRFSHNFPPGSKTVLMGETGVGKSTLIKLMLGLITPKSGSVSFYDSSRSVEASADTRCNITYVPQGNSLLDGTVRENLLLVAPDASEDQLREALHIAVADFVYNLPNGLDTRCGELGTSLSEGQAQRIAIARALLRKSSILLLDEFNSSLDQDTADTLINRLLTSRPTETIIFISHRPEVAAHCDEILRLTKPLVLCRN